MRKDRMTPQEFRSTIQVQATALASLYYCETHPGVSDEQGEAYAVEHWREWVDTALELMAYQQIRAQQRR